MVLASPGGYPPEIHMLRDLRIEFEHGEGESRAWIPCSPHLADRRGNVRLGVLATFVDVIGGGLAALAAAPGWIATADLTVHALAPVASDSETTLEARGRVLRAGRTTAVIECNINAGALHVAVATMTFQILERRETNPVLSPTSGPPVRQSMAVEGRTFTAGYLEALGIVSERPGHAVLEVGPYVVNSLGSVQGGALATLAEFAAETLDSSGAHATVDLQVSYLALAKAGPVRAIATGLGDDLGTTVATVEVVDLGTGRRTTAASARTAPVGPASSC